MLQDKLYWPRRWITRKTKKKIYGRKIPLKTIVKNEIDRLEKAGVVRHTNYKYMTEEQVEQFCKLMSEPGDIENARDTLHQKEKEWMLKMWHNHSDISKFYVMLSLWPYQLSDRWSIQTKKSRKEKNWRAVIHWETPTLHFWIIW